MTNANASSHQTSHSGHALIIGISQYEGKLKLPAAVTNDALAIQRLLVSSGCGYQPSNVTLLLNSEATLDAIRSALDDLAHRASQDDTVLIFFSGHGARSLDGSSSSLIPVDVIPRRPEFDNTVLSEKEFSEALTRIMANRLVVLVDACHSGSAATMKEYSDIDLGYSEKSLERLTQGSGRVLLASSRATETSLILNGDTHSLFTKHLLRALQGAGTSNDSATIRIFEVFDYVSQKVRADVDTQHPIFKASDMEDNFAIALNRGGVKQATASVSASRGDLDWEALGEVLRELYPVGPADQQIWVRAGGDMSQLKTQSTGRASWFAALQTLKQGGGGRAITAQKLIAAVREDFPHNDMLRALDAY